MAIDPVAAIRVMFLFTLICAVELIAILSLNHRVFTYTLDDPYLHLALAENIARGHYGLNATDYSAPSSSFIWPFLLAPFSALRLNEYVPLAINFIAALITIALFRHIVGLALRDAPVRTRSAVAWMIATTLVLATNLAGLVFTGMEHSLQLMLSVALVLGLIEETAGRGSPRWLPAVIVLGSFVRYENLALSLPALVLLAWRGRYVMAGASFAAIVLGLGGFSLFLHSHGLGWLPLSIVAKSDVVASGASIGSVLHNVRANLRPGLFLLVGLVALVAATFRSKIPGDRALAGWAAVGAMLHLAVGRFGWFARYEIYIWASVLVTLLYVYRSSLLRILPPLRTYPVAAGLALFLAIACRPYLGAQVLTPLGANNIYEQQYQMHRFADDYYSAPVGANDLGLLSYRNDHYVLDLEGLASKETRDARAEATGTDWISTLASRHGVRLAMLYASVLPEIPRGWSALGGLHLSRRCITPADSVVEFWALDRETASSARRRLVEFRKSLPPGVRFVLRPIADRVPAR